jgi:multidrug efflux pump subunit AcrA (membrane-fusion protein)
VCPAADDDGRATMKRIARFVVGLGAGKALAVIAVIVVAVGGIPVGGLALPAASPTNTPTVATATVQKRTLNATTQVNGVLGYAGSYAVANAVRTSADPSAALQAYVSALSQYHAALNALEALRHPKTTEVAQSQASLAQVEAALVAAEQSAAGPSAKDVSQARAQLATAQAQLAKAQNISPPASQVAQARAALAAAQAQLTSAQAAAAGPTAVQTAQAQAAVAQATATLNVDQAMLTKAQSDLAACQGLSPPPSCDAAALRLTVQQAQSRVTSDQAALASAQAQLAALTSSPALAQAQANLWSAQAAYEAAKAALDALTAGASPATVADLAAAMSATRAAQAALDALLAGNPMQTAAQLKIARAQVVSAQAALDALLHPSPSQLNSAQEAVSIASRQLDIAKAKTEQPTGVVTQLAEVGSLVKPGDVLYRLDGTFPVVLMTGTVPAWRRLEEGVADGADVAELKSNLKAFGFGPALADDQHWDADTTAAVKRWQSSLGLDETGVIPLGEVIFEPGALRITSRSAALGATIQAGAAVLQASSTTRVVTVALQASLQSKVKTGDPVSVVLPDGKSTSGKVTHVSSVAARAEGAAAGAAPTLTVLVTLDDATAGVTLDQAPVTVNITTATAKDVLAVPISALVQLLGGGYAVQVKEGDRLRYVGVKTGLFASGFVEISGDGLAEGQTVVVAE